MNSFQADLELIRAFSGHMSRELSQYVQVVKAHLNERTNYCSNCPTPIYGSSTSRTKRINYSTAYLNRTSLTPYKTPLACRTIAHSFFRTRQIVFWRRDQVPLEVRIRTTMPTNLFNIPYLSTRNSYGKRLPCLNFALGCRSQRACNLNWCTYHGNKTQ